MNLLPNWFPHQVEFPFIERFGAITTLSRGAPTVHVLYLIRSGDVMCEPNETESCAVSNY